MKWEYEKIDLNDRGGVSLYAMGQEGWELVCVDANANAYFKRPLPDYESTESESE